MLMSGDLEVTAKAYCLKRILERVCKRKRYSLSGNCDKFHVKNAFIKTLQKNEVRSILRAGCYLGCSAVSSFLIMGYLY